MFEGMLHTELGRLEAEARKKGWQEGRQEGRQEGLEEGLQEGRQEGLQDALIRIARSRLDASESAVERIRQIHDPETLSRLIDRALRVESLDELWGEG